MLGCHTWVPSGGYNPARTHCALCNILSTSMLNVVIWKEKNQIDQNNHYKLKVFWHEWNWRSLLSDFVIQSSFCMTLYIYLPHLCCSCCSGIHHIGAWYVHLDETSVSYRPVTLCKINSQRCCRLFYSNLSIIVNVVANMHFSKFYTCVSCCRPWGQ